MEGDWLIHESFQRMGPNWSPVLFWQGQRVKKNPSVKCKSRWTLGMNLCLLLAVMGLCCRWFFETLGLFSTGSFIQKALRLEERAVGNSHKKRLLKASRPNIWLTRCSQQSKDMPWSPAASVSWKKGKLTGVLHADMFTWKAGDLFSLHVTLRLQGEKDRSVGSEMLGTRRAGRSSTQSEATKKAGTSLPCKRVKIQAKLILFLFKIKWRGYSSGVVQKVQIQLVPSDVRSMGFKLALSLCHISCHLIYTTGVKAQLQWAPAGFFFSLCFYFSFFCQNDMKCQVWTWKEGISKFCFEVGDSTEVGTQI